MFFNLSMLNRQHKGKFGLAWTVATRGINCIKKHEYMSVDIVKLCDDLMVYIVSESPIPTQRFSLRLSGFLVNGTIKIYAKKVDQLLKDVRFIPIKSMTVFLEELRSPTRIPAVKAKKPRTKQVVTKDTPTEELQRNDPIVPEFTEEGLVELPVVESGSVQRRQDEISIREDMPRIQQEEHGGLGILEEGEFERILIGFDKPPESTPQKSQSTFEGPPTTIQVTVDVHAEAGEYLDIPQQPIAVPIPETTPMISEMIVSEIEQQPAFIPQVKEQPQQPTDVISQDSQTTEQPQVVEVAARISKERERKVQESPKKKQRVSIEEVAQSEKGGKITDKIKGHILNFRKRKIIYLNRTPVNPLQVVPLTRNVNECEPLIFDFDLRMLRMDDGDDLAMSLPRGRSDRHRSSSLLDQRSLGLRISERTNSTVEDSVLKKSAIQSEVDVPSNLFKEPEPVVQREIEVEEPVVILSPAESIRKRKAEEQTTIEEIIAPPAQKRARHTLIASAIEPAIAYPSEALECLENVPQSSALLSDTNLPVPGYKQLEDDFETRKRDRESRQQKIVDQIAAAPGALTLEDVARKPLNKFNIAAAFGDCLVLCKSGYVTLKTKKDSIELESIEKGPKLLI